MTTQDLMVHEWETIAVLRDHLAMADLAEAERTRAVGEVYRTEDVLAEFAERRSERFDVKARLECSLDSSNVTFSVTLGELEGTRVKVDSPELSDWLLAQGRTSVTSDEAARLLGVPVSHVRVRLSRQISAKRMFTPARGLWVPIPPQFRSWGVTPAEHFVDDLMRHLGRDYYVGWLSGAEQHGAAHQRPQVFQVAVTKPVADRDIERIRLRFVTRSSLATLPRLRRTTATGAVWVATPELTAFDLADNPAVGGGISNVATVLAELAEDPGLSPDGLSALGAHFSVATSRRLGYLLRLIGAEVDLEPLRQWLAGHSGRKPALLSPTAEARGPRDLEWNLIINTEVEPDL